MFRSAQHDNKRVPRQANQSLITDHQPRLLLGAHMSIRGGVSMAIERARSVHCTAMQMFVKNNMQWFARPLVREEIREFIDHIQRGELLAVLAHANYLINLAATNAQFHTNSIRALSEELTRADQLELPFLVLHPGAHLGAAKKPGSTKSSNRLTACWLVFLKSKHGSHWRPLRARDHAWDTNSSNLPTSSAASASPSVCVFASTPRTFSPPVTTSGMNLRCERPLANSIG